MSDTVGALRSRLAEARGSWRDLPDELRGRDDLPERLAELELLAESDPEVDVRYKARKVLSALDAGRARTLAPAAPPAALGTLAATVAALDPAARGRALERFAQAHRAASVDELVELSRTEVDPQVLSVAVRLIGQFGNASHLRDLRPLLAHASPRVVANAVEAMGRCDAGAALPTVLPALMSEDHRVRANVLIVLYESSREETLGYLTLMAASPQESYRAAAIWCLSQVKDPGGEPIALAVLKDEEAPDLVDALVRYLDELGTLAALSPLKRIAVERPVRAARMQLLIESIGGRLRLPPEELARYMPPASRSSRLAAVVSGQFIKLRKSLQGMKVLPRRKPVGTAPAVAPVTRRPVWPLAIGLAFSGLALVYTYRKMGTDAGRDGAFVVLSPGNDASKRASAAPLARPGTPMKLVGTVSAVSGATLVMKKDYTIYAVKYRDRKLLAQVKAGQRVALYGVYRAWNQSQGYVELDAAAGPGKR